ncbi:apolipoprotein N-acyltransferase [Kitasatospora sp. MAP12-44]|nr:apolipoprotein N-acyltransferase [Kitasatospora sp. MAP12-44]
MALPLDSESRVHGQDRSPEPAGATAAPQPLPGRLARRKAKIRAGLPRTALAAAAGLLLAAAFPPYGLWPLSIVAVAALSLLTRGRTARQGAWTGLAFGVPFFLWLLDWMQVIGPDAWIGLSVIEALFVCALGAGLALTSRLRGRSIWAACLWVAQEWARDRLPFGGFPWGRLAFANTASPYTPLAALGGAPLVTFAVALTGALLAVLALALLPRLRRRSDSTAASTSDSTEPATAAPAPRRPLLVPVLAGACAVAVTAAGYAVPVPTGAHDSTAKFAVIQGNVPHPGMDFLGRPMQVLDNHATETEKLAAAVKAGTAPQPDVVIWPENSSDVNPFADPLAYQRIDQAVKTIGAPTLVGALVDGPDDQHVQNEGIVWDPTTGAGAEYTKQHPVPFGEYVPFRSVLMKYITRLQRIAKDFYPGKKTGVLQLGPARIGDVICFEVAYDEIVRDTVNARRPGDRRADQQRHLRPQRPARPAARDVAAARGRARPGRGDRRDQRHQCDHPPGRHGAEPHRRAGARRAERGRAAARRQDRRRPGGRRTGVDALHPGPAGLRRGPAGRTPPPGDPRRNTGRRLTVDPGGALAGREVVPRHAARRDGVDQYREPASIPRPCPRAAHFRAAGPGASRRAP